jgi:hypothetical protein
MKAEQQTPAEWPEVDLGTEVSLSRNGQLVHRGTVVAKTTSGSTVWVLSPSWERRMHHINDGHRLTIEKASTRAAYLPH